MTSRKLPVVGDARRTAPEIVVLHAAERPGALGLDRPLPLLGAPALAPDGLAMAPGLDHLPEIRAFAADACRSQVAAGRPWYQHPPLLLAGEPGCGRGLAARWISRNAGVPLYPLDWHLLDTDASVRAPIVPVPDAPVLAMAASGCANPIIHLALPDDGLSMDAERRLADMLDPASASRRLIGGTGIVDCGNVSWILQARKLPAGLAAAIGHAGVVIEMPPRRAGTAGMLALAAAHEACFGRSGSRDLVDRVIDSIEPGLDRPTTVALLCSAANAAAGRLT